MKNLKTTIASLVVGLTSTVSVAQLHIDSLYQNRDEYLLYRVVEECDATSQQELTNRVRNWAGKHFANANEVLVSQTEDQLVYNYITDSFFTKGLGTQSHSWYFRMVVDIKDSKIRVSVYDDGNAFWPSKYAGGVVIPATPARTQKLRNYYFKDVVCKKAYNDGLLNVKRSTINFVSSLLTSVQSAWVGENNNW